jgi:hypothetical protein
MSKEQPKLPFAATVDDINREMVSLARGSVYNELKDAASKARQRGDLDRAETLESMTDDATKIDPDLWRDVSRVWARSKFDTVWWSGLVNENPGQFSSLRDMIIQYTTVCDAAHQRGENHDDRFFPKPEKRLADYKQQSRERANRLLRNAGLPELRVPDDE